VTNSILFAECEIQRLTAIAKKSDCGPLENEIIRLRSQSAALLPKIEELEGSLEGSKRKIKELEGSKELEEQARELACWRRSGLRSNAV
jgi:hypothetical protein